MFSEVHVTAGSWSGCAGPGVARASASAEGSFAPLETGFDDDGKIIFLPSRPLASRHQANAVASVAMSVSPRPDEDVRTRSPRLASLFDAWLGRHAVRALR